MDPNSCPLYAGVSGVQVEPEHFDLGQGVVLSKTFAHLIAPFLMAYAPVEPGKHNPGPLSAVSGGFGYDINIQLHVPLDFAPPQWFDRVNTIWWVVALLRLKASTLAFMPVISNQPFAIIPSLKEQAKFWPVEVGYSHLIPIENPSNTVHEADLNWIKEHWLKGGGLMNKSGDFNAAFQAFDYSLRAGRPSTSLMVLWGAIEQLFSPAKQELRFRVSAVLASFLEPPRDGRLALHKKIVKLYDGRSKVAHGANVGTLDALSRTYQLIRRALIKMIEGEHVPTRDELEASLFGC